MSVVSKAAQLQRPQQPTQQLQARVQRYADIVWWFEALGYSKITAAGFDARGIAWWFGRVALERGLPGVPSCLLRIGAADARPERASDDGLAKPTPTSSGAANLDPPGVATNSQWIIPSDLCARAIIIDARDPKGRGWTKRGESGGGSNEKRAGCEGRQKSVTHGEVLQLNPNALLLHEKRGGVG